MTTYEAIEKSKSLKQVLIKLKLSLKPHNYAYLRYLITKDNIDVSHFTRKPILEYPDKELLSQLVPTAMSFQHLAEMVRAKGKHSDETFLKRKSIEFKLDFSHFSGRWKSKSDELNPVEIWLVKNSSRRGSSALKHRLWKKNLLRKECYWCGITVWRNLPAPLELDHINGDPYDNRLENLRILCPNCHAQTATANGKNIKKCKVKNGGPTQN